MTEEINVVLERHDQHIKSLQHQVNDLKAVQGEIKVMNETLIKLTSELKCITEHLTLHEEAISEIQNQPRKRLNQITTAIISALAGGLITAAVSAMLMLIR